MELIRSWIIGVTCTAMIIAAADSITPPGTVKKLGKLTGGIVLLLAMLSPIMGLDYKALSIALHENRYEITNESMEEASIVSAQLMKTIIAEQSGAYILDKATVMGAVCDVVVDCEVTDENVPYPASVTVRGELTESQRTALSRTIEADLAIPPEMQTFESGDAECI